jgi:hypothetical protein
VWKTGLRSRFLKSTSYALTDILSSIKRISSDLVLPDLPDVRRKGKDMSRFPHILGHICISLGVASASVIPLIILWPNSKDSSCKICSRDIVEPKPVHTPNSFVSEPWLISYNPDDTDRNPGGSF